MLDELRRMPAARALTACDPAGVEAMGRMGHAEEIADGARLFSAGAPADALRFVVSGRIALTLDLPGSEPHTVGTVGRGELLGWSALRVRGTWTLDARATKPSRCLVFPGAQLRALCDANPRFGLCLMRYAFGVVAMRLADTRLQIIDVYGRPRTPS